MLPHFYLRIYVCLFNAVLCSQENIIVGYLFEINNTVQLWNAHDVIMKLWNEMKQMYYYNSIKAIKVQTAKLQKIFINNMQTDRHFQTW